MDSALFSTLIRAGRTTYFVDVKEAKNGKKHPSVSEVRITDEGKKDHRVIRICGESCESFRQAVTEATAAISQ
jgi:hypothetical protein